MVDVEDLEVPEQGFERLPSISPEMRLNAFSFAFERST
jgi:hypothetical protein